MKFRNLTASEIDVRVGSVGAKGITLLLYKNARCDMNILDEMKLQWQRKHYEAKGNMFCSVGIYMEDLKEWVWKDDCGVESYSDKEKGEASDSFKRACVNWGIGRELYTTPRIFLPVKTIKKEKNGKEYYEICPENKYDRYRVAQIDYKNDKISKLIIVDQNDNPVYPQYKPNSKQIPADDDFFYDEMPDIDLTCSSCMNGITHAEYNFSMKKYQKPLCKGCQ